MKTAIKWALITTASVAGASFAFVLVQDLRRRIDNGLRHAEQVAGDAKAALASTQQALGQTQDAVHHLRTSLS
jgi:predicted DNA-binding protein (UPF0278 family)